MKCSCGNENALHIRIRWGKDEDGKRRKYEFCEHCGDVPLVSQPDVYFRSPYFDEHLADKEHPHGQHITSKRHKAEILKKLNMEEVGSRKNPVTGKPIPYFGSDGVKMRKYFKDNFGQGK